MAMALNLSIRISELTELHWRSRFPGQENPALYMTMKCGQSTVKTRTIRGYNGYWNQSCILLRVEETQGIRFRLKIVMPCLKNRVIGEAEYSLRVLQPLFAAPYDSVPVSLKGVRGRKDTHIALVRLSVSILSDEAAACRIVAEAAIEEHHIDNHLHPDTVLGKVWQLLGRLDALSGIISEIDKLAELNGYLNLTWQICSSLYKAIKKKCAQDQKVIDLLQTINNSFDFAQDIEKLKNDSSRLRSIIQRLFNQIAECAQFICKYLRKSFGARIIGFDYGEKIQKFIVAFTQLREELLGQIHLQTSFITSKILGDVLEIMGQYNQIYKSLSERAQSDVLRDLNPSDMPTADRPTCLHGTREDVLQTITDWIMNVDENGENVLWLHGLAGSGKSTIATTIAERLHEIGRRGAFVFFERGKAGHHSFLRTIASQLANGEPAIRPLICSAIEKNCNIALNGLDNQFSCLLETPLREAAEFLEGPIVIVIDALDEYGDEHSRRKELLPIISQFTRIPGCFRFVVTSRPEADIEDHFAHRGNVKCMRLVAEESIPGIRLYLATELPQSRRSLPRDWPSDADLDRLAAMSEGIFVWASTLCKFVRSSTASPIKQVSEVLSSNGKLHIRGLDRLYDTVLSTQIDPWDDDQITRFRAVAGIALFCSIPISDTTIDGLLGWGGEHGESCSFLFDRLCSLFDYHTGCPIRPLHASFRDYLTDKKRSGKCDWSLASFDAHHHLATCCFNVMRDQLQINIHGIEPPTALLDDISDQKIEVYTAMTALGYASQRWYGHLSEVRNPSADLTLSFRDYSTKKFIQWLEMVMGDNTIEFGKVQSVALSYIQSSSEHLQEDDGRYLTELWVSFGHFMDRYGDFILSAPKLYIPQIYWSIFLFPQPYILMSLYSPLCMSGAILTDAAAYILQPLRNTAYLLYDAARSELLPGSRRDSGLPELCLRTYGWLPKPNHQRWIGVSSDWNRFVFSTNSKNVAVFDADLGSSTSLEIEIGNTKMLLVAFHPIDMNVLALRETRGTVNIWDISRNVAIVCFEVPDCTPSVLHGHNPTMCTVWSADGAYLALAVRKEVSVWRINLEGKTAEKTNVFKLKALNMWPSPTNSSHLLVRDEECLHLLDIPSGRSLTRFFHPTTGASCSVHDREEHLIAKFSPDGSLIAISMRRRYLIAVFDIAAGKYQDHILAPDAVQGITFVSNQKIIVVCGDGRGYTVHTRELGLKTLYDQYLERMKTSAPLGPITSLQLSATGEFLVSSEDGTIQVRNVMDSGLIEKSSRVFPSSVRGAVFSLDGDSCYAALKDGTINSSGSSTKQIYPPPGSDQKHSTNIHEIFVCETPSHEEKLLVIACDDDDDSIVMSISGAPDYKYEFWKLPSSFDPKTLSAHSKSGLFAFFEDWDENPRSLSGAPSMRDNWRILIVDINNRSNRRQLQLSMEDIPYSEASMRNSYVPQAMIFTWSGDRLVVLWGVDGLSAQKYYGIWDLKSTPPEKGLVWFKAPKSWSGGVCKFLMTTSPNDTWLFIVGDGKSCVLEDSIISIVDIDSGKFLRAVTFFTWSEIGLGGLRIAATDDRLIAAALGVIVTWDLSVLTKVDGVHTTDSSSASVHSSTMPSGWAIQPAKGLGEGAWIVGPHGEPMFWVPNDVIGYLDPPESCHVIKQGRLKIDTTHLMHGKGWEKCYTISKDHQVSNHP